MMAQVQPERLTPNLVQEKVKMHLLSFRFVGWMWLSSTAVRNWNKKSVPVLSRRATWSTFFFQATIETD